MCVCVCVCVRVCVCVCVCELSLTIPYSPGPCVCIWMNLGAVSQIPLTFWLFQITVLLKSCCGFVLRVLTGLG